MARRREGGGPGHGETLAELRELLLLARSAHVDGIAIRERVFALSASGALAGVIGDAIGRAAYGVQLGEPDIAARAIEEIIDKLGREA